MAQYVVGTARFYPTLGRWAYPGEVIDLPEELAGKLMNDEAGLLAPARQTTQARPQSARRGGKAGRRARR